MQFNYNIPSSLKKHYQKELVAASSALRNRDYALCWYHLERAHILGQPYPVQHTIVHWRMLCFGFITKNFKEILGQLPRLIFGGVKSFVGKVPIGNSGGSNVSAFQPMTIPEDLNAIIKSITSK